MKTNDEIREAITKAYGADFAGKVKLYPGYCTAFEGVSFDGKAIYNYVSMILSYAADHNMGILDVDKNIMPDEILRLNTRLGEDHPIVSMGMPVVDDGSED